MGYRFTDGIAVPRDKRPCLLYAMAWSPFIEAPTSRRAYISCHYRSSY